MANSRHFFDLPTELRNLIYSNLACSDPIPLCDRGYDYNASISSFVEPSLLCISKQFKLEYEQEIFQKACVTLELSINPVPGLSSDRRSLYIPDYPLLHMRNVNLTIAVGDWLATQCKFTLYSNRQLTKWTQPCFVKEPNS